MVHIISILDFQFAQVNLLLYVNDSNVGAFNKLEEQPVHTVPIKKNFGHPVKY